MLLEIISRNKNSLIIELSLEPSAVTRWHETSFRLDMISVLIELLNSRISWTMVAEQYSTKILTPRKVREIISKLDISESLKEFLLMFAFHNSRIYMPHLLRMASLVSDIKMIIENDDVDFETIIKYINLKYSPREDKAADDRVLLKPFHPLLFANNIDSEEFYERLPKWNKRYDSKEEVFKWVESQVNNPIHLNLFKKLLTDRYSSVSEDGFLKSLSTNELLEYLKLKSKYENTCTKYSLAFLDEVLVLSYLQILKNRTEIKLCDNCNKYFISVNGNKTCSEKCKKQRISNNKDKRNENEHYKKYTEILYSIKKKIETYERKNNHKEDVLEGLKAVEEYYRFVCKKIKQALIDNSDKVCDEEAFWSNFDTWCKAIIPQKGEYNKIRSIDEITYYKLTISGFQKENIQTLWDNDEFYKKSKYKNLLHKIMK